MVEDDPTERSVGYGGRPDRDGRVTLDACIMDENYNIGSVACMEHIKNPISVARAVMEKNTPCNVSRRRSIGICVISGIQKKKTFLLQNRKKEWKEWLKNKSVQTDSKYRKS